MPDNLWLILFARVCTRARARHPILIQEKNNLEGEENVIEQENKWRPLEAKSVIY